MFSVHIQAYGKSTAKSQAGRYHEETQKIIPKYSRYHWEISAVMREYNIDKESCF